MSLQAQVWLSQLPLDTGMNAAAFRVLHKLADAHHAETGTAWRHVDRIANELRTSKRTVQRALADLKILGFIRPGDQRLVSHLDARYRPTVYELALELWQPAPKQAELAGVTTDVTPSDPVDNSSRGDRHAASGVTTVVAHRNRKNLTREIPSATTDRATPASTGVASDTGARCIDGSFRHEFSRKAGRCVYCGLAGAA